ncbi:ATP-binding cassette domain-containing protein [Vibrio alginolyticus]
MGESGSGKSTTVRAALALYGEEATIAGSIRIDGTQMVAADERTRRRVRSASVSLVQQDPRSAPIPCGASGIRSPNDSSVSTGGSEAVRRRASSSSWPRWD